jgi:hypothetical protein
MIPHLFYYQLALVGLLWLCVMLLSVWPGRCPGSPQRAAAPAPIQPKRQRSKEPKPCAGLTHQPLCAACEPRGLASVKAPSIPPAPPRLHPWPPAPGGHGVALLPSSYIEL